MMDRETIEGVVLELDTTLDSVGFGDLDFEAFYDRVEALRDRLKFVLDNTPTD